jgi:uncharacterized protein HemY
VRNRLWGEAIDTLNKSVKMDNGAEPTDFLFLAMAYHGRADNTDAEKNYARGAEMARKTAGNDAESEDALDRSRPGSWPTGPKTPTH